MLATVSINRKFSGLEIAHPPEYTPLAPNREKNQWFHMVTQPLLVEPTQLSELSMATVCYCTILPPIHNQFTFH